MAHRKRRFAPSTKWDDIEKVQEAFLAVFRDQEGRRAHACLLANVNPPELEKWLRDDPVFLEKFEQCQEQIRDDLRQIRDDLVKAKDRDMLKMKLKTLPEHQDRSTVEHRGQISHAHGHVLLRDLTKEERDEILLAGAKLVTDETEAG